MNTNILIIDSDKAYIKGLKYGLEQDNYQMDIACFGEEAIEKLNNKAYDLVILDIEISDMDGLKLCQSIRKISQVPIIILTKRDDVLDKVLALEYGADDYLIKPINIMEFRARIKAILRRVNSQPMELNNNLIKIQNFIINTFRRNLSIGDRTINLTGKEFDLFLVLASNAGKVFTREELLELVWGYAFYGDLRTVDVHIRRIREKIEENSKDAEYILTKWGVGYYFKDDTGS